MILNVKALKFHLHVKLKYFLPYAVPQVMSFLGKS